MTVRAVSFGGGVQSTALLVLAARGEIDFQTFVFANVGENAESPATLDYIDSVAMPFAQAHGLSLVEVRKEWKDGRGHTLMDSLMNPNTRSIGIPIRMKGSGAPGNRACTSDFKILPIAKWMKQNGASKADPGVMGLGISIDEFQRARTSSGIPHYTLEYPLIDMRIDRAQCHAIIERAGLPVPPKSSCFFCPYHSLRAWRDLRADSPDLFEKAAVLEDTLIARRLMLGRDEVYLTDRLRPLREAVGDGVQPSLFTEADACESGYCMT